jgi:O-antigen/teichoic acid export membrane protein
VILFTLIAGLTIVGLHLFPESLAGPVGGRMIAFLVAAVWTMGNVLKEFGFHFDYQLLKRSFEFNRATFIYQLQQWSINYFDRFLMVFFLPLSEIGIYDFAVKCMLAIDFVIGGLYNSIYPRIISIITAQEKKQSTIEINRYYHGLTAAIMLLVCFGVLFFSTIIDLGFIGKGYERSLQYFPILGIIYLIRGMRFYFVSPYGVLKHVKPLPVIYLFVSLLKISGVLIFTGTYGVYAVIFSTIVCSLFEISLLWLFIREKFTFKFNSLKLIVLPSVLALALASSYMIGSDHRVWIYLCYPVLCGAMLWWAYRNEITQLKLSVFPKK